MEIDEEFENTVGAVKHYEDCGHCVGLVWGWVSSAWSCWGAWSWWIKEWGWFKWMKWHTRNTWRNEYTNFMLDMDLKSLIKPRKARSPKRPKARKPQSSKARVLTSKPDPKAQEPSPARPNNSSMRHREPLLFVNNKNVMRLRQQRRETQNTRAVQG